VILEQNNNYSKVQCRYSVIPQANNKTSLGVIGLDAVSRAGQNHLSSSPPDGTDGWGRGGGEKKKNTTKIRVKFCADLLLLSVKHMVGQKKPPETVLKCSIEDNYSSLS
jgi:hypothetical protein